MSFAKLKFLLLAPCICLSPAYVWADVSCKEDSTGRTYCYGKTENGEYIDITYQKDSSGVIRTTGKIGTKRVDINSTEDLNGNVKTSGIIGDDYVSLNHQQYGSNKGNTYGTIGSKLVDLETTNYTAGKTNTTGRIGNKNIHVDSETDNSKRTRHQFW